MNTFFDMHELVHLPGLSVVIFWVPGFQGSVNPKREVNYEISWADKFVLHVPIPLQR